MARVEADKEDLIQEAVSLERRIEFSTSTAQSTVVVGFRRNGWFSIYFGSDPMYQFDGFGRLRRSFHQGLLYRTQGRTLAQLTRLRTDTETTLVRRDLDEPALASFRDEAHARIAGLRDDLTENKATEVRRIPKDDATLVNDVLQMLTTVLLSAEFLAPAIAHRP